MKGIYTKFTNQTLAAAIVSTQVMKLISSKNGFYEFYLDLMLCSCDSKKAFETTNEIYNKFFKVFKYENYIDFYQQHAALQDKQCTLFIQRNFLMQFFKEKGFTTWESF